MGVCWRDRGSSADDRRLVGLVKCYLLLCISENRLTAWLKWTWQRAAAVYHDEKPKQTRESWHNTAYRHITQEGARRHMHVYMKIHGCYITRVHSIQTSRLVLRKGKLSCLLVLKTTISLKFSLRKISLSKTRSKWFTYTLLAVLTLTSAETQLALPCALHAPQRLSL